MEFGCVVYLVSHNHYFSHEGSYNTG